jgi:hypothetical protein
MCFWNFSARKRTSRSEIVTILEIMNSEIKDFSTEKLIQLALVEFDNNKEDYVAILHFRGDLEVLQIAEKLCQSDDRKERELDVNILGYQKSNLWIFYIYFYCYCRFLYYI